MFWSLYDPCPPIYNQHLNIIGFEMLRDGGPTTSSSAGDSFRLPGILVQKCMRCEERAAMFRLWGRTRILHLLFQWPRWFLPPPELPSRESISEGAVGSLKTMSKWNRLNLHPLLDLCINHNPYYQTFIQYNLLV